MPAADSTLRLKVVIRGAVQGVGFRPFVYRLATALGLTGWVSNSSEGVFIEAEAEKQLLGQFLLRIEKEKPPRSFIQSLESSYLDAVGYTSFIIRESEKNGHKSALILPDVAMCPECEAEIFDPQNRRYRYPFTNCTNCGPRFSIIESLPYDRPNTSMKKFIMCPDCRQEYEDPLSRRFHAQPNACPVCGPQLELWDGQGDVVFSGDDALEECASVIRRGGVIALKGIGGFQLMVDARNNVAVKRLRARKRREEKPFALLYPSLRHVREDCRVSELEERILQSPESPIVLLERNEARSTVAESIAPRNPYLGIMLPYSPLHALLMRDLRFPVVATSGNLSDEPICIDGFEALARLQGIADYFLVHNRPIVRHVDDSIVRILLGRELVLRRARGYAPLPVAMKPSEGQEEAKKTFGRSVLAVGAHLKNTVALSVDKNIFVSQHIGDLETQESLSAFRRVIEDFKRLYEAEPQNIVCDLHADYLSTQFAHESGALCTHIQHHYAHVASCMAENQLEGELLGVSWDGTGMGLDGTIWGGEFLLTNETSFERVAHFRPFPLPGGDRAIKEPRRSALGMLFEMYGSSVLQRADISTMQSFSENDKLIIAQMLSKGVNAPLTSSVGRIFDAVASICGVRQTLSFEGQAAMELEFACQGARSEKIYGFEIQRSENRYSVDWAPMIEEILRDVKNGESLGEISARFHNTLAEVILAVARKTKQTRVVLTGGCFQNKYLTERSVTLLTENGIRPYWHQRIPPNDGGIALGQIYAFARQMPKTHAEETKPFHEEVTA